ncbi:MAG: RusA family crossover junction endodeoxyribonuclease [Reyranella sp.]|uniref:RusA family crossover junction endodeoxyribonuclease n=1 Tax=Reyranella sp. TaxID=1929291 RepID=UPI003D0E60BF
MEVVVHLPGEPRGKGRPRFSPRTGTAYTDAATRRFERALAGAAVKAMAGRGMIDGPLFVSVVARFGIPASWPKWKRAEAAKGALLPTVTPDADNLLKTLDALNGVVFADDKQIVTAIVRKEYGEPGLTIFVGPAAEARAA